MNLASKFLIWLKKKQNKASAFYKSWNISKLKKCMETLDRAVTLDKWNFNNITNYLCHYSRIPIEIKKKWIIVIPCGVMHTNFIKKVNCFACKALKVSIHEFSAWYFSISLNLKSRYNMFELNYIFLQMFQTPMLQHATSHTICYFTLSINKFLADTTIQISKFLNNKLRRPQPCKLTRYSP